MQKRNVFNSPRLLELKKARRKVFFEKILYFFALILVFFATLVFLARLPQMAIREVKVVGNKVIDTEKIREIVERGISGKYIWLFPKNNIFYYPKAEIISGLQDQFKRLKNIRITQEGKSLSVKMEEREGVYIWCGENFLESSGESKPCYFLDRSGYIFDTAPYFSGNVYFKFYGGVDAREILGASINQKIYPKIISLKENLEMIGLKPVGVYISKEETEILLAPKNSESGPKIIVKNDFNLEKIAENLDTALKTEPLLSNFRNKYSSLEYIDLRFGNKVYYRFR